MKSLSLILFILLTIKSYSQETDKDQGLSLIIPGGYQTDEKRKERENRKKVEDLKPKDLSNQFSPTFDEYLVNRVINAGNDDLIAQAIRKEYKSNAQNIFNGLAFHSIILILAIGLFIVHNFKSKGGKNVLFINAAWFLLCFLCSSFYGDTIDDKLFMLSSNFLNLFIYSITYSIIIASFYVFQQKEHRMSLSQRKVVLLGFLTVLLFGLGFVTGGYYNEYFESFENQMFNILGFLLSLFLLGYLFFADPKKSN